MALIDNLVAYWKLEEASGSREDSHGSNDLADNNTVTSAAGKLGDAASFDSANSEYLSIADNTDLSTGDIDFTFAAWVYLGDKSSSRIILAKQFGTQHEYALYYFSNDDRFVFTVNATDVVTANNFGSPSTNAWYHVVGWHDSVNNVIGIAVNAGTADTAAFAAGVNDSNSTFCIGQYGDNSFFFHGRIDAVGFWKKVLSSSERTELYNSGNGLEYPFSSAVSPRLALLGVGA